MKTSTAMNCIEEFQLIVGASTRSFGDDDWKNTEAAYVRTWKSAIALLRERRVSIGEHSGVVSFDWEPLLRRHERHYEAMLYLTRKLKRGKTDGVIKPKFPRRSSIIRGLGRSSDLKKMNPISIAESVVYDIFLIMNIAAPGCCNLYGAKLVDKTRTYSISLANTSFELCVLPKRDYLGLKPDFLDLASVITWYDRVRVGVNQIPNTPIERALFALFHLARLDGDVVSVIWLFYALESLLQTKVGENFASIVRRSALLLELSTSQTSAIKKRLRELYDLRSAIVHGGFEVIHPLNDEMLDGRVEKTFSSVLKTIDFGFCLLVSVLQKMVTKGWFQLHFDEVVAGHAI